MALYTSRDPGISEAELEAREALGAPGASRSSCARTRSRGRALWRRCDIRLDPAADEQRILRLHIFHLLQTASLHTIGRDVGVPARGLHGEAYRGHIFWDELFVFPFLNLRFPMLTRSLLRYRYRRLERGPQGGAREGYAGAMFPWQSGSSGREETQELHLNPPPAAGGPTTRRLPAPRQRPPSPTTSGSTTQASRDREFLTPTAPRCCSRSPASWPLTPSYDARGATRSTGVMGPDEYHEAPGLDGARPATTTPTPTSWPSG